MVVLRGGAHDGWMIRGWARSAWRVLAVAVLSADQSGAQLPSTLSMTFEPDSQSPAVGLVAAGPT